jgi:hypothetical protein
VLWVWEDPVPDGIGIKETNNFIQLLTRLSHGVLH